MADFNDPQTFLNTLLSVGRQRETAWQPDAPHGTYPRVVHGYVAHCTKCGAPAAFYEVQASPSNAEWTGITRCQCRVEFDPDDPWQAGVT